MAKKPGAGGIVLLGIVLGLVTAYFVWNYLQDVKKQSQENWQPVVVAVMDVKPRTKITREMITITRFPQDLITPDALVDIKQVEGRMTLGQIKAKEQIRAADLIQEGQMPSLSYEIPPGMRAIAIAAGEVMAAGTAVKPGDHVDILATYHDPITNTDTTKMLLQNVFVLAVNGGETDAGRSKGANSSMTLAVDPKDAELLTAADRAGVLRVALRGVGDKDVIPSAGVTSKDFNGSRVFDSIPTQVQTQQMNRVTPIIFREIKRPEITIIRGTQEQTITP